ncbi:hypothetical protein [Deinococcus sp.]|uniref:hypothetical protein n=1 Tax=Deinococcus sp. TaxID=47478 RepID=UPI002869B8FB|nr:hypothetical protein [Deinococcus sp.]
MTRTWSASLPTLDTSAVTWRGRALRYLLIYLLLLLSLVTARYVTRDVRPTLVDITKREEALSKEREVLALEVQSLSNVQRVRDWAFAHGMHRFAEATKTTETFPAARATPAPAVPVSPSRTVEVNTQWK